MNSPNDVSMKLSIPASEADREDILVFFTQHPELKKGQTILRWIKEGIKRDSK